MRFCDQVGSEILSERVATQHPAHFGRRGSPESNSNSLAYVAQVEEMQYFAGGFNGGTKEEYLKMSDQLSDNIEKDFNKKIIAIWHDESHMNRYFIDNKPTRILDPGYFYGETMNIPFRPRLLALDKNHKEVRA
jgi:histo-blood group ABO system transferase